MRIINTAAGQLKMMNFDEFVREVTINRLQEANKSEVLFNVRCAEADSINALPEEYEYPNDDFMYMRKSVTLVDGSALLTQFMSQFNIGLTYLTSIKQILCGMEEDFIDNSGVPTHIVKISKRTWMMTDISRFTLYKSGEKCALVCLDTYCTKVVRINRLRDASDLIDKINNAIS